MSKHPHHICKNCGNHFTGNFCNQCGQSAHIHEINHLFIWHELKHGFLHWNEGMAYTVRQLFVRPGHTIREFIEGKRVKHFSPVALLFFIAGAYGIIAISSKLDLTPVKNLTEEYQTFAHKLNEWTAHHYAGTQLMLLPLLSFASYLLFRKQGYSFFEHLVLNTFITIQKLAIGLCFLPFQIWKQGTEQIQTVINIQLLVVTLFACWTYSQFFQHISKPKAWLLGFLTQFLLMLQAMLATIIIIEVFKRFNGHI